MSASKVLSAEDACYSNNKPEVQGNVVQVATHCACFCVITKFEFIWILNQICCFSPQDAKILIEHFKTVSSSQPAGETPSKAITMINRLVTAYRQECNVASRNAKVLSFSRSCGSRSLVLLIQDELCPLCRRLHRALQTAC